MSEKNKIISIIPAIGWNAVYGGDPDDEGTGAFPLACFALCSDEHGNTVVRGMDASCPPEISFCDKQPDFLGYVYDNKDENEERSKK